MYLFLFYSFLIHNNFNPLNCLFFVWPGPNPHFSTRSWTRWRWHLRPPTVWLLSFWMRPMSVKCFTAGGGYSCDWTTNFQSHQPLHPPNICYLFLPLHFNLQLNHSILVPYQPLLFINFDYLLPIYFTLTYSPSVTTPCLPPSLHPVRRTVAVVVHPSLHLVRCVWLARN